MLCLQEAHGAQGHADDLEDDVLHTIPDQGLPAKALASLQVAVKAAQALSMLLILKQFLEAAYSLAPERVNSFQPTGGQSPPLLMLMLWVPLQGCNDDVCLYACPVR